MIKDAVATYDAAAKTITFVDDVLINAAADRIFYLDWFANVVLSAEETVYEEPVLTDKTAELPYMNTFETNAEQAQVAIYDANNDQSTFTFEEHTSTGSQVARYRYNFSNAADDYLVFPGVALKAGTKYKVALDAASYSESYPERIEVVAGKVAKASELTIPVIAATDVATKEFINVSNNEFTVTEDGTYFFAVHAISDANEFYLYIDNFSIAELDNSAPAAVSDLAVVADAQGANKATVSFTVPAQTIAGAALTEAVSYVVKRDGEEIKAEAKAAGEKVSFEDAVEAAGYYTYSVTVSCAGKTSDAATLKAYIGYDTPDVVSNITVADKSNSVDIAWDAPAKGAEGYVVNPADFKYNIYPVEIVEFWGMKFPSTDYENPYATGLTETSANVAFDTNSGEMGFTYFAVTTTNTTGESDDAYGAVVTGAPYQMPLAESVAGGELSYWWGTSCDSNNDLLEGGLYLGENSSDGDGNCLQMVAKTAGWMTIESGKIALAGAVNPVVTFDYSGDVAAQLTVSVITPKGVKDNVATFTAGADFAPATVSLVEFANEDWVRVIITGTFSGAGNAFVDNIRVYNMLDNNLVAKAITATSRVQAGEDVKVNVTVENQGSKAAEAGAYTVDIYCNDAKVESIPGTALESNATTTFEYTYATNVMTQASLEWKAVVEYAADGDMNNNTTATTKTTVKTTNYPAVTTLAGTQADGTVSLTWSEPEIAAPAPVTVTDDFESYDSFTASAGDWTFVDVDGAEVGGFQGTSFSVDGVDIIRSKQSFWVHDVTDATVWNQTFEAHSGTKYLAAMFRYDDGQADDWAISPELTGNAQTVSFYAKSYSSDYPEQIEVYYSTGSKSPADFIKVNDAVV
ncbi:MAG: CARDB domain-containing protein, partial [Prevotella sp.]|nr:CARDB domain-containing protein [Prevotella sp.]